MNNAIKIAAPGDWMHDLGPLKALLVDAQISEIMINSWNNVFVEREGVIQKSPMVFTNARIFGEVINALCIAAGREVNRRLPYVDARLPDGSRMNIVVEPVATDGPIVTIRKHALGAIDYRKLVQEGTVNDKVVYFLNKIVDARRNIVVTGGAGSGKTTMLSVLTSFVDGLQRLVVIEDTREAQIQAENFVRMELPQAYPGEVQIRMAELVRNALRMRPDRIVVGECRGGEALDMLLAMNTGHAGSMTTIHANSAVDGLTRLETMGMQAGSFMPRELLRESIGKTIQFVLHMDRALDGKRFLSEVLEIRGSDKIGYQTEVIFNHHPTHGFRSTGAIPLIVSEGHSEGLKFPANFFLPQQKFQFSK